MAALLHQQGVELLGRSWKRRPIRCKRCAVTSCTHRPKSIAQGLRRVLRRLVGLAAICFRDKSSGRVSAAVFGDAPIDHVDLTATAGSDLFVMGGDQEACTVGRVDIGQQLHDPVGAFPVEVPSRLVGEHQFGRIHQGAGDGDSLFLPTRKLAGKIVTPIRQPDAIKQFSSSRPVFPPLPPIARGGRKHHVFKRGEIWQ